MAGRVLMADVLRHATTVFGVTTGQIKGAGRKGPVMRARQAVCYLSREAGRSYPAIGQMIGRHHSTIIHDATAYA